MLVLATPRPPAVRQLLTGTRPDLTLSGYPEYATAVAALPPAHRAALAAAADRIIMSLGTRTPVRRFVVVGHADAALRVAAGPGRAAFELAVSRRRAEAGRQALVDLLVARAGPPVRHIVRGDAVGVGHTVPAVAHAATEEQMRRNRRVAVYLVAAAVPAPCCGP